MRCRCPSPTKIGNLDFKKNPCFLSENMGKCKTLYTVEAIHIFERGKKGFWLGINQTRINRICEYFIKQGAFAQLVKDIKFRRDGKYGTSRIDFVSKGTLLEIKTPLTVLPTQNPRAFFSNYTHHGDYERTIKHYSALTRFARTGKRAIVLLAYIYPAPLFDITKQNGNNKRLLKSFREAQESGVEFWQANFGINRYGIRLLKYRRLIFKLRSRPVPY